MHINNDIDNSNRDSGMTLRAYRGESIRERPASRVYSVPTFMVGSTGAGMVRYSLSDAQRAIDERIVQAQREAACPLPKHQRVDSDLRCSCGKWL